MPVRTLCCLTASALVLGASEGVPTAEELAFFEKSIRPVLAAECYDCHSVDADKLKAGLFLDSRESILRGGDSGPSIIPGKPDESLLIETIRYTNVDLQMPPKTRLTETQVADLEKWVAMGAPWPDEEPPKAGKRRESFDLEARRKAHWSWHPPVKAKVPAVEDAEWPLQQLDSFVLARLEAAGLKPAGDADRRTWIRRVSFDLQGLPPTPAEVEAFVEDSSDDAHEKVVDHYLASPSYGVKWGRHWLDLARYAESYGHEFDYSIPHAWKYRDHIVRAFNADVPHDQMIREAIAGDLVSDPRMHPESGVNESITATGFWWLGEASHAPTDVRGDEAARIDNQVEVFSKSFLGLTVSCARCHDHKFDAISDEDYYSLTGYLQSSRRAMAPRDPHGRIAAGVTKLREIQGRASHAVGAAEATPPAKEREGVLWGLDHGAPADWRRSGEAFPAEPTDFNSLQVSLLPGQQARVPGGVWHSGLYGASLHGVLRSPTFELREPKLHLRLLAEGDVKVRVVVDGYFMNDFNSLLFRGIMLEGEGVATSGKWMWKTIAGNLDKYVGHRIYLEFVDGGDGFIGVDEIGYKKGDPNPPSTPAVDPAALADSLAQANEVQKQIPPPDYVISMTDGTPEDDRLHIRGGHANLGEELPRRFLEALGGRRAPTTSSGRMQLAEEVTSPENPLTARVQVNRLWHHLTGRGLVATVDDFGVMGEDPSHPELLDHLAGRFIGMGWSNRSMIREIVLSRTYRMSCVRHPDVTEEQIAAKDPANQLLHSFRVRRLPSESLRDGVLAVSQRLDPTLGGHAVPVHLTSFMEGRGRPGTGPLDGAGRRSIYTAVRRNFLPPLHLAFDFPVPFSSMGRRSVSNVPAQALVLMNDPFIIEQAGVWARRLIQEEDANLRLDQAFQEAFSRVPSDLERSALTEFVIHQAKLHGAAPDALPVWKDLCHLLYNKKEFIFLR